MVKGRSAVELLLLLLLLRFVAGVIVVDVSPDQHYYPDHYPLRRSFGSDPPDPVMKGLRREKEAEAKVLCGCLIVDPQQGGRPLPPLFVARRSNDGSLKCHNRGNASATAQRDRSHCPCDRGSAVARTLARLLVAWGWVKSRVFGDHVKWVWHDLEYMRRNLRQMAFNDVFDKCFQLRLNKFQLAKLDNLYAYLRLRD